MITQLWQWLKNPTSEIKSLRYWISGISLSPVSQNSISLSKWLESNQKEYLGASNFTRQVDCLMKTGIVGVKKTEIFIGHSIFYMDRCIQFMTSRTYECPNPAIASVRKPIVVGMWVISIFFSVVLIWGAFAPIDSAAVAKGSVTLLSNKKIIQHLEGGIIEELFVKDGDHVVAGDKLIRLSNVSSEANRDMLQGQLYLSRASESRLISMRDKIPAISFSADILEASKTNENLAKILASQTHMFESQLSAQGSKLDSLHKRITQSEQQIKGLTAQRDSTTAELELLRGNLNSVEQLVSKQFATKTQLIGLQRNEKSLEGNLGQYSSEIAKVEQSILETQMTIETQASEFDATISDALREAQSQVADLTDKLRAAKDVSARSTVTSPTEGIVNAMKYHTKGGIIQGGTPIMEIIPQSDQLIIEAHVKPADISIVRTGLDAKVMFTSYKSRATPKVPGKIIQVSADKIVDPQSNPPEAYYIARVEVDKKFIEGMNKHIELYPGMPADVLIRTGSRSLLHYMFSPITDSMHRAFREE